MASPEWLEIYRSYTPEELAAEVALLKKQSTIIAQQSTAGKSFTRDLQVLSGKLSAAVRIQNERRFGPGNPSVILTDFRGV